MVATADTTTGSLRLNRLIVSQFMRIEALKIDAKGKHVLIQGKNRSGKTSAVDAIWACLGGKPGKDMPEPIHRGADKASVRLELCGADGKVEYIAERIWETGKDSKLTIVAADGSKKPAKITDGWIGKWMMNPKRFMDARPQDQLEELLGVAGVVPPVDDVANILGERIEAKDEESADAYLSRICGDGVGVIYHRRTLAHQTATQKAKAAAEAGERLMQLGGPLEEGEKELTASEVIKQIEAYQVDQEAKREKTAEAASVRQKHREGAKKIGERKIERARQAEQADELVRQIEALQRQLEERRKSIAALDESIVSGSAVVAEADADAIILEEEAAVMPDRAREIEGCRLKLAAIEHTNLKLSKRRHAAEEVDRLAAEAGAAECDHKTLDGALESLRNLRAHQLDDLDLGITGLSVGDGELRLNGISFKQASQAERLRVACLVAFKQNPKLRLLRVDEAECFDSESQQMLVELADQYDFQIIETRVSDVEALKWEIVEAVAA